MGSWQFTPFSILYFGTVILAFVVAYISWQMRPTRGAAEFSFQSIFTGIWLIGVTLGLFQTELEWKLIFIRFEFLGITGTMSFWLLFVLKFGQFDRWMNKYSLIALFFIPVATFLQILFIDQHSLFYQNFGIAEKDGFVIFIKQYNPGFYLWIATSYTYLLGGHFLLVRAALLNPKTFRHQILPISFMAIFVVISNILYLAKVTPIAPYDPTPVIVGFSGLIVLLLIYRYKLFDLIPASRNVLFQNIQNGVIVLDRLNRMVEINPMIEKILDISKNSVLGKQISTFFDEKEFEIAASEGKGVWQYKDTIFDVQLSLLKDTQGALSGKLIVLHDITQLMAQKSEIEQKALELNRQNQSLGELSSYKQGLTQMIAHDMKNPLNVIISLAGQSNKKEDMQEVVQSGKMMLQMIHNMLDIQKFEEAKMQLSYKHCSVSQLVVRAKYQVELLVMAKSIKFINETDPAIIVKIDQDLILRVLVNLYSNAIKYMPIGGRLTVTAMEMAGRVQISVSDTGKGIPEEMLAHVFDKFWQSDPKKSGTSTSSGLGLTFCKMAVMAHGGAIEVDSTEGEGTTFHFDLAIGDAHFQSKEMVEEQEEERTSLTTQEQQLIRKLAPQLREIPIYKSSKIESLLKELEPYDSPGLMNWKQKLREASYSFDNKAFEELTWI